MPLDQRERDRAASPPCQSRENTGTRVALAHDSPPSRNRLNFCQSLVPKATEAQTIGSRARSVNKINSPTSYIYIIRPGKRVVHARAPRRDNDDDR